jgi:hypothetical protein
MSPRSLRLVPALVVLAAALPAGPAAADVRQDLRSPDAQAAGLLASGFQDVRSPDARTPVTPAVPAAVKVDLRSPDAVDGASGSRRDVIIDPGIVKVTVPVVDDGFQWGDAGIGAGIIFGLLVLSAGGYALMVAHRRSTGGAPLAQ